MSDSIIANVSEIFGNTIQGEGPFTGVPATFIRLHGCKNYCPYCDSKYSWQGEPTKMSMAEIYAKVNTFRDQLIVLTGGEPLMQPDVVKDFCNHYTETPYKLQIETSGKVSVTEELAETMCAQAVVICSPKYLNGIWFTAPDFDASIIDYFKFVVRDINDILAILLFIAEYDIDHTRVYLMPEGASRAEQIQKMPFVVEQCVKHGFKMSPRLHVLIWDTKRGV